MSVEVCVLGPLEVTRDGQLVKLPGPRERSILTLLAARAPRAVSTEQLVEDLWGEHAPPGRLVTLRSYVSTLRRSLREHDLPELIQTRSAGYAMQLGADSVIDAQAFAALLDTGEHRRQAGQRSAEAITLRTALALWRGRALAEVADVTSMAPESRRLEESRLLALERWAEAELACGHHAEILPELGALCAEHPSREALWAARIVALYRCGRHADALEAYRELYRHLREELGIAPSTSLRTLEREVLEHAPTLGPGGPAVTTDARRPAQERTLPRALRAPASGAFAGRRRELARLRSAWSLSLAGSSRLVAVHGPGGAGKTRLVGEWAQAIHNQGALVLYGRSRTDHASPHQPFIAALGPHARAPDLENLDSSEALAELLGDVSTRAPTVLVLDDLHLARPATLALLAALVKQVGPAPVLLIGCFRDAPPGSAIAGTAAEAGVASEQPATLDRGDALPAMLQELGRDHLLTDLPLGGLEEDDVARLIAELGPRGGEESNARLARRLHEVTEGNPLFIHRLLARLSAGSADPAGDGGGEALYALASGSRALEHGNFTEAAAIATRALAELDLQPSADESARCELTLLLARARLLGRDIPGAKLAAREAADLARDHGSGEQLVQAAIAASYLNVVGLPDPDTVGLCREALELLEPERPETVHVLAGWADHVAFSQSDPQQAEHLSTRAVRLARKLADHEARHRALFIHGEILACGTELAQRLRLAGELLTSARAQDDLRAEGCAWQQLALARLERGDRDGFDAAVASMRAANARARYWYLDVYDDLWRGMRAMLADRLDEVERLSEALLARADTDPNVANLYMGQIFFLRREQGRGGELVEGLTDVVAANPGIVAFRCGLALIHAEAGQLDLAREHLAVLAADSFAAVPRDASWTTSLLALGDVAAEVGDVEAAETLRGFLEPYSGRLLLGTKGLACLGSADRLLGRLAATSGRWEEAEARFRAAERLERGVGSRLLLARTRDSRARALRARALSPDSPARSASG